MNDSGYRLEAARLVLTDAKEAIAEFAPLVFTTPAQTPSGLLRRRWLTAIVLLREVGHVLAKVDATQSTTVQQVIDDWWRQLKTVDGRAEHQIFHEFIERARNLIAKEYRHELTYSDFIPLLLDDGSMLTLDDGTALLLSSGYILPGRPFVNVQNSDASVYASTALDRAASWWDHQLETIELRVLERMRTRP